ncbi:Ms5788A family Cys-rich leader peptide [Mycobacterium helveticum]
MPLGEPAGVSARFEPMLTKRDAVDLCRIAGCCCSC